jgi:CRP-like cAMP-binding protein
MAGHSAKIDEQIIETLQSRPLFKYFDADVLRSLVDGGSLTSYRNGEIVLREAELSPDFFIVVTGSVNVSVRKEGKDVFICTMGEGEIFGEAGLFSRIRRTASVTAPDEASVLRLSRQDVLRFVKTNSQAGVKFLMVIIFSLLRKLREANQELAFERKFDIGQDDIDAVISEIMGTDG